MCFCDIPVQHVEGVHLPPASVIQNRRDCHRHVFTIIVIHRHHDGNADSITHRYELYRKTQFRNILVMHVFMMRLLFIPAGSQAIFHRQFRFPGKVTARIPQSAPDNTRSSGRKFSPARTAPRFPQPVCPSACAAPLSMR